MTKPEKLLQGEAENPARTQVDMVDFRPVKAQACEDYPPGHPYREAVLQTPDVMPAAAANSRIAALVHVLLASRHVQWPWNQKY